MAKNAAGVIVQAGDNRYLSRSLKWVHHRFNKPERAYVHPSALIALGGPWAKDAAWIIPAVYDSETTYAVVKGNAVSFMYFLAQQKTAS